MLSSDDWSLKLLIKREEAKVARPSIGPAGKTHYRRLSKLEELYFKDLAQDGAGQLSEEEIKVIGRKIDECRRRAQGIRRSNQRKISALHKHGKIDELEVLLTRLVHGRDGVVELQNARRDKRPPDANKTFIIIRCVPVNKQTRSRILTELDRRLFFKFMPEDISVRFVKSLSRLVLRNAAVHRSRIRSGVVDFLDVAQSGMLGVLEGFWRYEAARGFKPVSYVSWWIAHSIGRDLDDNNFVTFARLPVQLNERIRKISRFAANFSAKYGSAPSESEIAEALKLKTPQVKQALRILHDSRPLSIDSELGRDDSTEEVFVDGSGQWFMEDKSALSPERHLILQERTVNELARCDRMEAILFQIANGFNLIRVREIARRIIKMRILPEKPRTLDFIGRERKRTRESVRLIQEKIMRRCFRRLESEFEDQFREMNIQAPHERFEFFRDRVLNLGRTRAELKDVQAQLAA